MKLYKWAFSPVMKNTWQETIGFHEIVSEIHPDEPHAFKYIRLDYSMIEVEE